MLLVGKKYKLFGAASSARSRSSRFLSRQSRRPQTVPRATGWRFAAEFFMRRRLIMHILFGFGRAIYVRKY